MISDDTAVSESLGYILLFAIALTAIGIILLTGNSIINNERSNDNFQNMIQSFSIIQSDLTQVALEKTPVETTMIHMEGGSVGLNNNAGSITVYTGSNPVYDNSTGQLIFTKDNDLMSNVSIENGGVWEASDGYSYVIASPRIYVTPDTNTLVLNIIKLYAPNGQPIADSGSGTMNIEMSFNQTFPPQTYPCNSVTLQIDTNYTQAWENYLSNMVAGTSANVTYDSYSDGVKANISSISDLIISEHEVDVTFSGLYD
jgi:hypothetical protein